MSILNVSGIQFSDSTSLFSKYGIIPQNSVGVFFQAAAPTGWTKLTSHNDKALRVVTGTGGGFGSGGVSGAGGISFTTAFPSVAKTVSGTVTAAGTVENTTLTIQQIPSHSHAAGSSVSVSPGVPGATGRNLNTAAPNTSSTGGGQGHNHPFIGTPSPFTSTLDLRVQYIDVIICSFD
jgi:microcystin-dependent protein